MPYIEEVCIAGKVREHIKYYSWYIHPPGQKREKVRAPSEERIRKANQRKAEKTLRRLMNNNFKDGDLLVRLDFHKEPVTTSADMQRLMANFVKRLRRRAPDIKYIFTKEIGRRGGRHAHMIMSDIPIRVLTECWPHGGIHIDPLYSNGQYAKIAAYFIKYAQKTEETEGELVGKRWYGSRNLVKPLVRKKIILANSFRRDPPQKKGWNLEKESLIRGITDSGYEYLAYSYIRADTEESSRIFKENKTKEKRALGAKAHIKERFKVDKYIPVFNN